MKHILPILTLVSTLAISGCTTAVGVDNPDNSSASWSGGSLTTTYKSDVTAVFVASKRALDGMRDLGILGRVGETEHRAGEGELTGVTLYARAIGDVQVTIDINKASDATTGADCTSTTVRWGTLGNCQQSQQVIHRITQSLGR